MSQQRLDKLLTASGLYSRSEARTAIGGGRVTVDGRPVTKPETKVSRLSTVMADGRPVDTAEFVYYMMNKPAGYISATEDERLPAVTGLLPRELQKRGLFPVGRLDGDVTGLLLLTDDGAYAHRVTSPKREVPKCYEARLDGPLNPDAMQRMAEGICLRDGTAYKPARLSMDPEDPCHAFVTVTEGKFHEVKNLFAVCGRHVLRLRRISIGALRLDESLEEGQFRPLSAEETESVFSQ